MQAHRTAAGKAQEEFFHQFGIKAPDFLRGDFQSVIETASPGNVHGGENQRLVHRQKEAAVAGNAPLVPQSLPEGLTQADAQVLHAVVVVYVGISHAAHLQVKFSVGGEQGEHMVQEPHPGAHFGFSRAVQVHFQGNVGFRGIAGDFRRSHGSTSCRVSTSTAI